MNSPFKYGKIAEGDQFANRAADINRLSSTLSNKTNTMIIAPRKWGKSSLVRQVTRQLSTYSFYRFCFLDLFKIRNEKEFYEHFANEVIKSITTNTEERIRLAKEFLTDFSPKIGFSLGNDLNLELDFTPQFSEHVLSLASSIANKNGLVIYIFIDNFQAVEHFEDSDVFLKKLSVAWREQQNVAYCLYGSKKKYLERLFLNSASPLYKFGETIFLDKISIHDLATYVTNQFQQTNKSIPLNLANRIVGLMDQHPFYVQQLAHIVWEKSTGTVNENTIIESVNDLIGRNLLLFQREFENLSNLQINFLKVLNDGIQEGFTSSDVIKKYRLNSSPATLRAIEGLEKKEIIEKHNNRFEFIDPAFKLWFKKMVTPEQEEIANNPITH